MSHYSFNYPQGSIAPQATYYSSLGLSPGPGNPMMGGATHVYHQPFPRPPEFPMMHFSSNTSMQLVGGGRFGNSFPQPYPSSRATRAEMLSVKNLRRHDETTVQSRRGTLSFLPTAGMQRAGSEESLQDRLSTVPSHKKSLFNSFDVPPHLRGFALDLLISCNRAEQEFRSWEPGVEQTDRLLQPISRPTATTGLGSRRGLEAYQCLWLTCGKRISKRANAISHLLSHFHYKPFLCNQCLNFPRFRYKHDYARHCRSHTFSIPQVDSHRY